MYVPWSQPPAPAATSTLSCMAQQCLIAPGLHVCMCVYEDLPAIYKASALASACRPLLMKVALCFVLQLFASLQRHYAGLGICYGMLHQQVCLPASATCALGFSECRMHSACWRVLSTLGLCCRLGESVMAGLCRFGGQGDACTGLMIISVSGCLHNPRDFVLNRTVGCLHLVRLVPHCYACCLHVDAFVHHHHQTHCWICHKPCAFCA